MADKEKTNRVKKTYRILPKLAEAVETLASKEHRTEANLLEVILKDYFERNPLPEKVPAKV